MCAIDVVKLDMLRRIVMEGSPSQEMKQNMSQGIMMDRNMSQNVVSTDATSVGS